MKWIFVALALLRRVGWPMRPASSVEAELLGRLRLVAIEFAKELLKAVYQYSALVSKLKALKKP
jgi:hypothetical protein